MHRPSDQPPVTMSTRITLWLIALVYAAFTLAHWSVGYIDFGDGNYMYISKRIADGAVLYRDILAPQPPCHLMVGALIVKISRLCGAEHSLYFFRGFSLLLQVATFFLLVTLARKTWGRMSIAILAGLIYLWLPIGFWWALGYQSEPLEIFLLLAMMTAALRATRGGDIMAGLFAALAALTNATAAPFLLVLMIFMLVQAPRRALRMALPCLVLAITVTVGMELWTGGHFMENVVFNQIGTFPFDHPDGFAHYAVFDKLLPQGTKILAYEGAFLFLGLIGTWRYFRESPLDPIHRGGLGYFFIVTLGSLIYVTKGGTVDYIFCLSEPAVAILAAGELRAWLNRWRHPDPTESHSTNFLGAKLVATLLLALFALGPGLVFHARLLNEQAYELDSEGVRRIRHIIQKHSASDEPILAPPYYAFLSDRRLWGDYSELYIWTMSYYADRRADRPEGPGWTKIRQLVQALERGQLPLVILEMDQTGRIPEVMDALRQTYVPIQPGEGYIFRTLNTRLGFFRPKLSGQQTGTTRRWREFFGAL